MEADNLHKSLRPPVATGELVLQTGRQTGARRPLGESTTFIGRAQGCDIRLNVDGVDPMHCLLVFGPTGLQLRDLASTQGTFINGVRTDKSLLAHGDVLKVGPFQFRVELPALAPAQAIEPASEELRQAVRVQAAAIAAQQAALDEEEARLQQRRSDLHQQEEQLAAHLADKQRQIQLWTDYTKAERETLAKDKLEQEKRLARLEQELVQARLEVGKDHQKLTQERQRIHQVYKRLRQRWQRQWSAEKEKHKKHAQNLHVEALALEDRQRTLQTREADLAQHIVQFNTERELGMRQLQDGRAELNKDRHNWRRRRSHEFLVLKGMQRQADETQVRLMEARQLLIAEKDAWDKQLDALQKELHGLNNRIVHQRLCVEERSTEVARLDALLRDRRREASELPADADESAVDYPEALEMVDAPEEPTISTDRQGRVDNLEHLASELADQRAHLLEQYKRLAQIQEAWQQERDHASFQMENLAKRLVEEQQSLAERGQQVDLTEDSVRQRQQESEAMREELQVWLAQLKARDQLLEEEQQKQRAELSRKETLLHKQLAQLGGLRKRWTERRQQEVERLRSDRAALDEHDKETQKRRVAIFERNQQVEEEKRVAAEKALALEQYRQEVFFRANDPDAQRRVERLRRRWLTLNAALIRNAKAERESVRKDFENLDALRTELAKSIDESTQSASALADRQAGIEEQEVVLKAQQALVDEELAKLEGRRQNESESHLRLQNEIDALAKAVYEGPDETAIDKAA